MSSLPHEMHTTHSISAVYFNKTIKWDHHQQVAKKLLAVAAVIHEAIQWQDNFEKLYLEMKQITILMGEPLVQGATA